MKRPVSISFPAELARIKVISKNRKKILFAQKPNRTTLNKTDKILLLLLCVNFSLQSDFFICHCAINAFLFG